MIDQKINKSLNELEQSLKDIDSARKQVEKTVNSYNGLNESMSEYVSTLETLTTKVKDLVIVISKDYSQKVTEFEKERKSIVDSANDASKKISDAVDSFQSSLNDVKSKLKYSLILNAVIILVLAIILLIK